MAADRQLIERLLARPVAEATRAAWGFTNRTDIVTLADGEQVVVQRYRRREHAEHRLRVMRALWEPAAEAGIVIPRARESDLDAEPSWVVFDALPGVPIPEAGDARFEGPRFPEMARLMGELLAAFRHLPAPGLELDDLWADPGRLSAAAERWAEETPVVDAVARSALAELLDDVPALFAGRPAVLAHGDFAPVNVLTDGAKLTGLLDFEAVRLADPLFDAAWWAWSVSFAGSSVLKAAWPEFLAGAGIDATEPDLPARLRALQVLRMLELVAGKTLSPDIEGIVSDRLRKEIHG
jgi:aminoglycoside phosphotransferase (APT) family kinase protein